MAYRVFLLEPARRTLAALTESSPARARDLALVLLSLRKTSDPLGSRALESTLIDAVEGERIWERHDWIITYKIEPKESAILVAQIEERA